MSFLDRFRGLRQETTQRLWGTTAKKNAPPTYVNDFILEQAWARDEPLCQAKMVRMNPYAWAVTVGLANSVFEDGFYFVDPEDEEKEIMQETKKELHRMECLKWFALALAGERAHGHTWLFVGEEELQVDIQNTDKARIANLDVFTPEYATVTKWDDVGAPEELSIKILNSKGHEAQQYHEKPIPVSECVLVRTRPYDRSHEGLPITGPIWNALVSTALIDHAITTYAAKMGLGALILTTKGAVSSTDLTAAKASMKDLSISRVGVIPGRAVEKMEYMGASGSSVDFSAYTDIFLNEIAAGTKIPKSIIVGAADIAAGVEVGPGEMAQLRQGEQTRFEPVIREVVRRMGVEDEYNIFWPVKMAVNRKEEAETRMMEAQANMMEAQAEMAKEGRSPNDSRIEITGDQEKPKDEDKNQNPAGSQVKE